MTRRLVATLLLLCALAGAAVALPPWQQYGGDAARTGNSHEDGFIPGVIAWQLSFTGNISDSPAVDSQGTAYIGVSGGYMAAVYLQTGTQKWLHRYTTDSQSSPALSNDEQWLYVGGTAGLHQLSTANGYTQWVHSTGGAVVGSPVVDAETGLIYAVSANNVLYCVRPTNSEVWRTSLAEAVTPTIVDNYVLALSPSLNKLVAYKKDTGSLAWYTPAPYLYLTTITGVSSHLVANGAVLFGSDRQMWAYSLNNGTLLWSLPSATQPLNAAGSAACVGDDATVFWGGPDGNFYAANMTGIVWTTTAQGPIGAKPVTGGGNVYFTSTSGDVHCADVNGTLLWVVPTHSTASPLALSGFGLLLLGTNTQQLVAIGQYNGPPLPSATPTPTTTPKVPSASATSSRTPSKGSTRTPTHSTTATSTATAAAHHKSSGGGVSPGAAAGISISVIVVVGAVGFFAYRRWRGGRGGYGSGASAFGGPASSRGAAGTPYSAGTYSDIYLVSQWQLDLNQWPDIVPVVMAAIKSTPDVSASHHVAHTQSKTMWYIWLATLPFVFAEFISICAAASQSKSKSYDFFAVWVLLQMLALCVGGTMLLRKESLRSPLSVGFFIGCTLVMAMEMLELAVLSAGNLARFGGGEHGAAPPAEKAVTGFSVLLFLGYSATTAGLILFRSSLLPAAPMASTDDSIPHVVGDPTFAPPLKHEAIDVDVSSQHSSVM